MEIVMKKTDELIPYDNNPRFNDDAVEYVAESIKEFGFKVPIVIDRDNVIVTGHTRLKASKELGLEEVPCIIADDLSDEQIKAYRLADNKVGEIASWDYNKLDIELGDLQMLDFDMDIFGFKYELQEEDFEPINDNNMEDTITEEYKMTFGRKTVIMTSEEYDMLSNLFNEYCENNGVSFGFVRWLCDGNG